jgi:hypothetical protein
VLDFCEEMIQMNMGFFSIATLWFKRRKELLKQEYFPKVESWLFSYIHSLIGF